MEQKDGLPQRRKGAENDGDENWFSLRLSVSAGEKKFGMGPSQASCLELNHIRLK